MHYRVTPLESFYTLVTVIESFEYSRFAVVTRYDGYGNSRVYFEVVKDGKETTYEKFNAAAEAWNMYLDKLAG